MKSKFNKPDTVYPHGSLRPIWETKPPERKYFVNDGKFDDIQYMWACKDYAYDQEKNSRTIPCSANNWKDGQELEEGKDYEVITHNYRNGGETYAVPIVQETEDELIEFVKGVYQVLVGVGSEAMLDFISKSKFTIKRKL